VLVRVVRAHAIGLVRKLPPRFHAYLASMYQLIERRQSQPLSGHAMAFGASAAQIDDLAVLASARVGTITTVA